MYGSTLLTPHLYYLLLLQLLTTPCYNLLLLTTACYYLLLLALFFYLLLRLTTTCNITMAHYYLLLLPRLTPLTTTYCYLLLLTTICSAGDPGARPSGSQRVRHCGGTRRNDISSAFSASGAALTAARARDPQLGAGGARAATSNAVWKACKPHGGNARRRGSARVCACCTSA